jgi:hypothetical protein
MNEEPHAACRCLPLSGLAECYRVLSLPAACFGLLRSYLVSCVPPKSRSFPYSASTKQRNGNRFESDKDPWLCPFWALLPHPTEMTVSASLAKQIPDVLCAERRRWRSGCAPNIHLQPSQTPLRARASSSLSKKAHAAAVRVPAIRPLSSSYRSSRDEHVGVCSGSSEPAGDSTVRVLGLGRSIAAAWRRRTSRL